MADPEDLTTIPTEHLAAELEARSTDGIRISFAGKSNARTLARKVRPRVQRTVKKYCAGSNADQSRNLVIEGDNLQAMATLYGDHGQVDLIVTDPPYNTGKDFRYNDKWEEDPNDPDLGDWVSEDDGARHTKWMRFMWPRLQMMKAMLKPRGVLAICIDHRELFRLGQMLDELFGERNRLAIINWQKSTAPRNDKGGDRGAVSTATEYVLVYAKDSERSQTRYLPRSESANKRYRNPDDDPEGLWREHDLSARTPSEENTYGIQSPFTGEVHYPSGTRAWSFPKRKIKTWLAEWGTGYVEKDIDDGKAEALMVKGAEPNKLPDGVAEAAEARLEDKAWPFLWFGMDGRGGPRVKRYLESVKKGMVPITYWADDEMDDPEYLDSTSWDFEQSGLSQTGIKEMSAIVGDGHGFETVKPLKLIAKLIQIWCPADGLVLDAFAGTGTTGHAVLALNADASTSRRFILIEQGRPDNGDSYARSLLADRLRRVINGKWKAPKKPAEVEPTGGGFRFVRLDKTVDAETLLSMEREEMADTIIASHFDSARRRRELIYVGPEDDYKHLAAINPERQGFFLIWGGADADNDLTEQSYEEIAAEAERAGLERRYHVYARRDLYQTKNVAFYQIPDRILMDFGLDLRGEPYYEDETE